MDFRGYIGVWLLNVLYTLDLLAVVTCFATPLVLIYFMRLLPVSPYKREVIYFGILSFFCGVNQVSNLWNPAIEVATIVKFCFVVILWRAVRVLISIFAKISTLKQREFHFKNEAQELRSRLESVLQKKETRKMFNELIREIRSTTSEQTIVKSTVVGLGRFLNLEDCALWLPRPSDNTLCLSHCMKGLVPINSSVPMSLSELDEIFNSAEPVRIPLTSPLVEATSICQRCMNPEVVSIRVPLSYTSIERTNWGSTSERSYGVIVLVRPSEGITKFSDDEMKLLGFVVEQVAVALAHAASVDELRMACDHLKEQITSLEVALQDRELALRDTLDPLHGIATQMSDLRDIIPFLSSFLLETALTPEQRTMVEAVLMSSTSIETLQQSLVDFSRLENGHFELNSKNFDLSSTINQAVNKVKPVAVIKKLLLSLSLSPNLPANAIGDPERLMQVILNILANAMKFTREGSIFVTASVVNPNSCREWGPRGYLMVPSRNHFYMKVEIRDPGCGIRPELIPDIFDKYVDIQNRICKGGLGLPICKRLLLAMGGDIWVESEGPGRGTTVLFVVKLRKAPRGSRPNPA